MDDDLLARWEALDEREHEIASMRLARREALRPAARQEPASLGTALRAEHVPTRAELMDLVGRTYGQPVVSLYLNLDLDRERGVSGPQAVLDSIRRREVAARAEMIEALPASQRFALRRDLHDLDILVRALEPGEARGLVAFKSGHRLNRALTVSSRTADVLAIDTSPRVEPLMVAVEEHARTLVLEVAAERAQFWTEHLGHVEEVRSAGALALSRPAADGRDAPGQPALSPRQFHLMTTARLAGQLFQEQECSHVVLAGDRELLAELACFLPDSLRERVAGMVHPAPGQDRDVWRRRIQAVLVERRRVEEAAAVASLAADRAAGLLASGVAGVIDVLNRFLARRLLVGSGLTQPGYACRQHHYLSLSEGTCPFCGAALIHSGNLTDDVIEFARLHGVDVMMVEAAPELLAPYDGVAVVRFELPAH